MEIARGAANAVIPQRSRLIWLLKLAAGLLLFWIAFRDIEPAAVAAVFARSDPLPIAGATVSVFLTVGCVAMRWRTLLGHPTGLTDLRVLGSAVVLSQVANIVMPFRIGDAVRIGAVSRALRRPPADVVASVAVERVFDALLLGLSAATLGVFGVLPAFARSGALALAATVGVALAAAVLTARYPPVLDVLLRPAGLLPARARAWLGEQAVRTMHGMRRVTRPRVAAAAFGWSVAVMAGSALTAWLVLHACGIGAPATAAIVVVIAVQVGGVVLPIPGAVGVSQVLTVETLKLWGVSEGPALGYALMLYLVARVPKIAVLPFLLPVLGSERSTA